MNKILTFILTLFLLLSTPAYADTYKLSDLLTTQEYELVYEIFSIDPRTVIIHRLTIDGPGDKWEDGKIRNIKAAQQGVRIILLDAHDYPDELKPGCSKNKDLLDSLIHEMVHVQQTRRGPRFKRKADSWRKLPYERRPHEIEAYQVTKMIMKEYWPSNGN